MHPKYWKRHVLREVAGEGAAGGGALDMSSAADAFLALGAGDNQADPEKAGTDAAAETTDAAAERLAAEETAGKDEGEQDDKQEAAAPEKFTIEVDGKQVELTKEEMAEHYKNGLRQKDYTQKTMEAAETRKAAEAEQATARAKRDEYAGKLNEFAHKANYEVESLKASLTEELLHTDPVEYLSRQRTLETRHAELQQAQQELQHINDQRKQEAEQAARSHLESQQEQLLAKVPEWKDAAKFKAEAAQIKSYLAEQGFAPEESNFSDHRAVLLARKAMQFDALMNRAKDAVQKVKAAPPKVERPGGAEISGTDGRTKAMKQLGKTGSLQDAAAAFLQFT